MLRYIRSWLAKKAGEMNRVPPPGPGSFETLEPRLLLNADFPGAEPALGSQIPTTDPAIHVDLAERFILLDDRMYAFEITGTIDPNHALVIDPNLDWSTYLGGGNRGSSWDVAVDASGAVYITGEVMSLGSMTGGFDTTANGGLDAFVMKFDSSGQYLWGTYLGGSGDEVGYGIAVDASGGVYVTGSTNSSDWTSGGFDTTYNGGGDAFVAKLSSDGQHLWSMFLGGREDDCACDIAVDPAGDVFVTGSTHSPDWVSGGFDVTYNGESDAFVVKLGSDGRHLWSTYVGGGNIDSGQGVAVDVSGSVYVTGGTRSLGWTAGGFDVTANGVFDAFVAKLGSDGQHLWSTYLGGRNWDYGYGIAVDASDAIYVTGYTESVDWTSGGSALGNVGDAFVSKLSLDGQHLWTIGLGLWCGNLGEDVVVDAAGAVYVTGQTASSEWTSSGSDSTYHGGSSDAFVAKLSPSGAQLWGICLGGNDVDQGKGVAVDASGNVYVTGHTESSDWTVGGYCTTGDSGSDGFLLKLSAPPDMTRPSPNPSTWQTEPYATGATSIRMVATPATDDSGVEYYFRETSGHPGGTDSGWQDSNVYEDTGLTPGTVYSYEVKTRDKALARNETTYSPACTATTPSPVYRFWATDLSRHFYTISEGEKNKVLNNYSNVWTYEQVAYYAFAQSQPGTTPIYRFWSASLTAHFYTENAAERDKVINNHSDVWTYEGIAFYAYLPGTQPTGTGPVFRFWSGALTCHFHTISPGEKDKLISLHSHVWQYEDIAWYAYGA